MQINTTESNKTRFRDAKCVKPAAGFTLIELMIVVVIIGILATFSASAYKDFITRSELTELANQFSQYERAFEIFRQVNGAYPGDTTKGNLPPNSEGLGIDLTEWQKTPMIGGQWNWEGPDNHPYAGIAISGASAPRDDMIQLDVIMDDGDLGTGRFQKMGSDYTYIID